MRWSVVWSLARAEIRSILRLIRYWLFAIVAMAFGLLSWGYYSVIHGLFSSYSGSVGAISPKFLMTQFASFATVVFAVGVVFLAFDVRARDTRDRVVEVLDARPYSNLELVFGRWLGTLIPCWAPLVLTMILIQFLGTLAETFGWFVGEQIQWGSVLQYVFLEALPALGFYVALVYLVSLGLRNRLISAIAGLVVIGVTLWANFSLPIYSQPVVALNGGAFGNASEIVPQLFTPDVLWLRGALILATVGLLFLSSTVHPRLDESRRGVLGATGAGLCVVGVMMMIWSLTTIRAGMDRLEELEAIHEARLGEPLVDLQRIRGSVSIDPGRSLALDLEIDLAALDEPVSEALFSLNPGIAIESIAGPDGGSLDFEHAEGLLDVRFADQLQPGETSSLRLVASGRPDPEFAYLDSVIRWQELLPQNNGVFLLGIQPGFFDRRAAVLLPGLVWLPRPGPAVATGDPRRLPSDFFELDIEVTAPDDWTVVGPGRLVESEDGRGSVRLRPGAPVPEVALIAGRFERRSTEVSGVLVEALFDPDHDRNLEFFEDAAPAITERVESLLADARNAGIEYPYPTLSVVEVPWYLRRYGGGWRMDTIQAPPGMLLLSEGAFPTARFEFPFRDPESFEDTEGGLPQAKVEALERFFENDFSGGNLFQGAARNLFGYQTAARGPEAFALNALCGELANRLVTDKSGYFSVYAFDEGMGWVIGEMIQSLVLGTSGQSMAKVLIRSLTDRPEVWSGALDQPLSALDPWEDPKRSVNVLSLKASALADAILDGAGREKTARMLELLLERHRGATFDADDFRAAATDAEIDLGELVGDFLDGTSLPGFLVSSVRLDRLRDDDQGLPRYQTRMFVRNGEPVPGLVRLRYVIGTEEDGGQWQTSEPVRIAGNSSIELGLVTSKPPRRLLVAPYLSLNRREFPVNLPQVDEEQMLDEEPLRGARPADWSPQSDSYVMVDDLDPGFSVTEQEEEGGFRLGGGLAAMFRPPDALDEGLPSFRFGEPPSSWSRVENDSSWGRYRRTAAVVQAGDGNRTASFETRLPEPGRWRLELHMPTVTGEVVRTFSEPTAEERQRATVRASFNQGWSFGSYELVLHAGGERRDLQFDAEAAGAGWSSLGDFDLEAGDVRLELSDVTSGTIVIADAIRFVRLDSAGPGGER